MALAAFDAIVRPKVVLAKSLYSQGAARVQQVAGLPDRVLAIIAFDWAIETVLKAAVLQLDESKQGRDLSGDLTQKCRQALAAKGVSLPDEGLIGRVRSVRNAAQHEARVPTDAELMECRIWSLSFLCDFVNLIWGVDFERLSVSELIRHDRVRAMLIAGEQLHAEGNAVLSAAHGYGAVQRTIEKVRPAIVGQALPQVRIPSGRGPFETDGAPLESRTHKAIQDSLEAAREVLERMQDVALFNALSLDYATFVRFGARIGSIGVMVNDQVRVARRPENPELDLSEAAAILAWCADIIVQIETRVHDLDAPFGVRYWPR